MRECPSSVEGRYGNFARGADISVAARRGDLTKRVFLTPVYHPTSTKRTAAGIDLRRLRRWKQRRWQQRRPHRSSKEWSFPPDQLQTRMHGRDRCLIDCRHQVPPIERAQDGSPTDESPPEPSRRPENLHWRHDPRNERLRDPSRRQECHDCDVGHNSNAPGEEGVAR